ncbi:MAG TPA: efflux RND transporter periplasmic adaptor subunit [Pseudomonadales bacterium]|nr:efflux RND transporter periplasmic adaptor subunit [Pseudomonadales bacterium]
MKNLVKYLAPIVVIGLGVGGFVLLQANKPKPEEKQETARAVSVFVDKVQQSNVDLKVTTSGQVRARTQVDLVAQVGGRVESVSPQFIEGGLIEPNAVLLKIEDTDYRLALSQANVQVAQAKLALDQATADADVARKQLRGAKGASALALKKPQIAQARAQLAAAEAALEQAQVNLKRTHISLPFKGRVISKAVDIGQYVSPGTILGKAFATDVVEVRLPFTDSQLATLGVPVGYVAPEGGGPEVSLSAQVAGHTNYWNGHLVRLDASVDPQTREIYGTAQVMAPYGRNMSQFGMPLAVGLFVSADIAGKHLADALVIPRDALRAGNKVYVVNAQGRLEIRDVDVADNTSSTAILSDGVKAGDRVVVSSIRNPIPGMALEVIPNSLDESTIADTNEARNVGG